jgi:3-hydroxyisobutyrate dehydrogenase-like beta-hydroxyacid dehydrogenase
VAEKVGFIGLGNMGGVLAANLVGAGFAVVAHDAAGPSRCPEGASFADRSADVARQADIAVLSLPDGTAAEAVATELAGAADRRLGLVIDTSTIGVTAAETVAGILDKAGVAYIDAPVSGGVAGARARTLVVMYSGAEEPCRRAEAVIRGLSDRRHRVGDRPGMAQALKLANNFLSATALAATSEAVAFGTSAGLDMATMLEVLNAGSGQSAATTDKFPKHVVTGRYSAGFTNTLMAKDLRLYLKEVEERGGPASLGALTAEVWRRFAETEPNADFTRIYPFIEAGEEGSP